MAGLGIPVRIAAVDSNLKCVGDLIVRVLKALHGTDGDKFAGFTNATPDGVKTLERQHERLLAQKVEHEEAKMALLEEQRRISPSAADDLGGLLLSGEIAHRQMAT